MGGTVTAILERASRSARKPKGHGHTRRAEILRVAERIFIAEGYEGATIRKIAEEVGVSSTSLYMHFRDKDDILLEICTDAMEQLTTLNAAIAALPIEPVERVRRMLEAYVAFALENPNAYRLVFCVSPPAGPASGNDQHPRRLGEACRQRFLSVVEEIAAEGRLRCGEPEAVHQVLWTACHGLVSLRITKPDLDWAPTETLTRLLVDGLLFGLIAD